MPDLLLGESDDAVEGGLSRVEPGSVVLSQEQLRSHQLELGRARSAQYEAERVAARAKEQNRLLGERLQRLEALVQSAFARSVRTLSSSRGQLGRSVEADQVVRLVEEHVEATQFLDQHEVPGDSLLGRLRWLHDAATRTIPVANAEFFAGVDLGFPMPARQTVVEVRGDAVRVVDENTPTIPAPALPPKP